MIKLQELEPLIPTNPIEIDFAILDLQMKFKTSLSWLSHSYGKSYRIEHKKEDTRLILPEVYVGNTDGKYTLTPVTPDNDKKGIVFFVAGKETPYRYEPNTTNYLTYNVGIVFWANLQLIDSMLSKNEDFTQLLIKEVRDVLTNDILGAGYRIEIFEVAREKNEVYKEFTLHEQRYTQMPFTAFRFNVQITLREKCELPMTRENALLANITKSEMCSIIIPSLDFSGSDFDCLTQEQKEQLILKLNQ